MAGDWLKLESSTPDKMEVLGITSKMGWDDPDLTVGKLFRVWRWFDQQTVDGNAAGVTPALLDKVSGVTGFSQAMIDVGWLVATDTGVALPKFDRHNGATAKMRAQTAKRVANHRSDAPGNAECNGENVTGALAREEKRREEKTKTKSKAAPAAPTFDPEPALLAIDVSPQIAADWLKLRKTKRAPVTATVLAKLVSEAGKAGVTVEQALVIGCSRGWAGFEADWISRELRGPPSRNGFDGTDYVNRNRKPP